MKAALESEDLDAITATTEALGEAVSGMGQAAYAQADPADFDGEPEASDNGEGAPGDDTEEDEDVIEGEFSES